MQCSWFDVNPTGKRDKWNAWTCLLRIARCLAMRNASVTCRKDQGWTEVTRVVNGWVFVSNEHTDKCRPLGYGFQLLPVWSKIVNTFCLTSLKKGYVSVRYFLAEEGEGRNVAVWFKKTLTVTGCPSLVNFFLSRSIHIWRERTLNPSGSLWLV